MRIKQFLYEVIFSGDIRNFLDVTKTEPYQIGYKNGMRQISKHIRLMIDECFEDRKKYPTAITEDFIIKCIKSILTDKIHE